MTAEEKEKRLRELLRGLGKIAVAFSGGVDSSYLLKVASEELGENVLALTVNSAVIPQREMLQARKMAEAISVEQLVIEADIGDIPHFTSNPPERCYYCKKALFSTMVELATGRGVSILADGTNVDDRQDHRPGMKALSELKVRSPLQEAGFTKQDVRSRSKALGLETWDLPSYACLASRFPYRTEITTEALKQVDRAESALHDMGFFVVRVRHHGEVARIEIGADEMDRLLDADVRRSVIDAVREAGFAYVALDLQGYRTGSLNEVLDADQPDCP